MKIFAGISRKDAESRVNNLAIPIIEHLINVLKWDDPVNYDKHVDDVDQWLRQLYYIRLKPNGKNIDGTTLFYWLFFEDWTKDMTAMAIRLMSRKYGKLHILRTDEQVYNEITTLFKRMATDIDAGQYHNVSHYLEN